MIKILKRFFLVIVTLFPFYTYSDNSKILNEVKQITSQVIDVLSSPRLSSKKKRKEISAIYYSKFDSVKFAKTTLKKDWKSLSKEQRKLFSDKFAKFLLLFYLNKIDFYDKESKVKYIGVELKGKKKAVVKYLVTYKNKKVSLNYRIYKKRDKGWYIYDIEIEGIKISTTYRSQFRGVLHKKSFKGLIKELEKLIKKYDKNS